MQHPEPRTGAAVPAESDPSFVGLVLAAGAGSRMGKPKALVRDDRGSWLERAALLLACSGASSIGVTIGAARDEALVALQEVSDRMARAGSTRAGAVDVQAIDVADWATGQSASVRAGLWWARAHHTGGGPVSGVMITLVDLPDLPVGAARRVLTAVGACADPARTLARAVFGGVPGHPVWLGAEHWLAVEAELAGDRGAGPYLRRHGAHLIECGDLGDGADRDS